MLGHELRELIRHMSPLPTTPKQIFTYTCLLHSLSKTSFEHFLGDREHSFCCIIIGILLCVRQFFFFDFFLTNERFLKYSIISCFISNGAGIGKQFNKSNYVFQITTKNNFVSRKKCRYFLWGDFWENF